MTNMNTADFLSAVDHAAGMNDRWLFVASLVVFGMFAAFVMRYFVRQHERLIADAKGDGQKTWGLKKESSAIIVLDKQGNVVFFKDGALTPQEVQATIKQIESLL